MYKLYLGNNKIVRAEFLSSGESGYYTVIYPDTSVRRVSQIFFEQDYRELDRHELKLIAMTDAEAQVSQISCTGRQNPFHWLEKAIPTLEQRLEKYYTDTPESIVNKGENGYWREFLRWAYINGYTMDQINDAKKAVAVKRNLKDKPTPIKNEPSFTIVNNEVALCPGDLQHDPCNEHSYKRCWAPKLKFHMRCERCGHFQDEKESAS